MSSDPSETGDPSDLSDPTAVALPDALERVVETTPLVAAVTNKVTVAEVAQVIDNWGGLPVMSEDDREIDEFVAAAQAVLLNVGTITESQEVTMVDAADAAAELDVPVVLDPVGVGATGTRDRVAAALADRDVAVINGNYGEITALTGADAEVRGVESVGEYDDIAATAVACAQQYETVVVASGETDVVATETAAYEVAAGTPEMGNVVGTGCTLGGTLATFLGALPPERAALAGTAAFGLAGEAAAAGGFGDIHGPASFQTAFRDAVAGLAAREPTASDRITRVLATDDDR